MVSELLESDDEQHLVLLSSGTQIDDDKYIGNIKTTTELIVCSEEQI